MLYRTALRGCSVVALKGIAVSLPRTLRNICKACSKYIRSFLWSPSSHHVIPNLGLSFAWASRPSLYRAAQIHDTLPKDPYPIVWSPATDGAKPSVRTPRQSIGVTVCLNTAANLSSIHQRAEGRTNPTSCPSWMAAFFGRTCMQCKVWDALTDTKSRVLFFRPLPRPAEEHGQMKALGHE
uniref:Uncharacterized protein n=1 Tax=Branchiostoma floridae TaxID=7739 RepID=C3ZVF3_BRAFL|eukprot:XP_002587463.1 hypothetical protein BRAFLDRAFT_100144 [Branchiostoma floridae]